MTIGSNPHLKLQHYIDCLILEARHNSDHMHNARAQLVSFIEANYTRNTGDTLIPRENDNVLGQA